MTDFDRDGLSLRDEDRLPWLEAVDDEDDYEGISPFRVAVFVLAALILLAAILAGIYWIQKRRHAPAQGDGTLITAPAGDYKVKPDEPGGMTVEGKGDTTFAASEGAAPEGKIDLDAIPEAPVTAPKPAENEPKAVTAPPPPQVAPAPKPAKVASAAVPASSAKLAPKSPEKPIMKPTPVAKPVVAAGSGVIQLGAFASEVIANSEWKRLAARFAFLGSLSPSISQAQVGGKTYYRLQSSAGGQARDVCGKLKVAGENCLIVAN
jgi:outer membrane biosynthesis protein TonB